MCLKNTNNMIQSIVETYVWKVGNLNNRDIKYNNIYLAIDLKSFYASVECRETDLNPLTTN